VRSIISGKLLLLRNHCSDKRPRRRGRFLGKGSIKYLGLFIDRGRHKSADKGNNS
jgi:hypothetical protein